MKAYAMRALQPARTGEELSADMTYVSSKRDAQASGIFRYLQDFQGDGIPIADLLKNTGEVQYTMAARSVPHAETLVASARKKITYDAHEADFTRSVEQNEAVLERVKNRVYRYASAVVNRLLFESVPEGVIERTRGKVEKALASVSPSALEKFAVAYEELNGQSTENWTNACTAVRRILLDFADAVYPPREESVDDRAVGAEEYVNRLWAYAKEHIRSESGRGAIKAELADLGNRIDAIYRQSNKGVHAVVTRDEAERIIVRTYLLLADLL
ncbi:MAG: hypothetical protein HY873_00270 [Chloroflexi bacterium]|nr:hypothetical protein [Chloroflexota bacterium]